MFFLKLISAQRSPPQAAHRAHRARLVIAVLAFGLLRTVVDAWYAGANAASARTRLVTRNAISLVFPMPLTTARRSARSRA